MRDSQVSRVYAAERSFNAHHREEDYLPEEEDVQKWVDKLTSYQWYKRRWGKIRPRIVVSKTPSGKRGASGGWGKIEMGRRMRYKMIVLHEMSHAIKVDDPAHGRDFCRRFLELVWFALGKEDYYVLKHAFKEYGVKFHKKKNYTSPVSEKVLVNLRKGREKRNNG